MAPVSAAWRCWSLAGQSHRRGPRPLWGRKASTSAVGYLVSPRPCLPKSRGLPRGAGRREGSGAPAVSERPLCAATGPRPRSARSLRTEPLQPASCRPSPEVSPPARPSGENRPRPRGPPFRRCSAVLARGLEFWGRAGFHSPPTRDPLAGHGSRPRAGLSAFLGAVWAPTASPKGTPPPGLGQEALCKSLSVVGSSAFRPFSPLSTFPPRSSGCFPNIAAKVNGNPHSTPVRSVTRSCPVRVAPGQG